MFDNFINEIIYFNGLDRSAKSEFICSKLSSLGYKYHLQHFVSSFGRGQNIIAFSGSGSLSPYTVLTAHYDGKSLFDNDGGVFALIDIAELILKNRIDKNFVIVFTDQEEQYQQGSHYFLKDYADLIVESNINIDGFGIGDTIHTLNSLPVENSEMFFLTDSNNFEKVKIKSTTVFSSFESEIIRTKKNDVYSVFKEYAETNYFVENFKIGRYSKIIGDLWTHLSL